ncbi:hypothetical protein BJY59DRAFT_700352 [Rhodotorula toruloides]
MALIGLASVPAAQASPLLGLPVELLEQIFDDACNDAPPTRPLCRALLPLFDSLSRQRHKRVKIRQPEALLDYGRTVQWRPIVGELCESLTVTQEGGRFLDNVPPVDLRNLLPRLPNLVKLDLTGSALVTNFSEYAASGLEDEKRLPDLRTLALTSSDQVDYSSPFPIEGLYPFHRLERLSITISYLSRGANDYPAPSFPSLRYLSFKFRIVHDLTGITRIIEASPALRQLEVHDYVRQRNFHRLLEAAARLGSVTDLTLEGAPCRRAMEGAAGGSAFHEVDEALARARLYRETSTDVQLASPPSSRIAFLRSQDEAFRLAPPQAHHRPHKIPYPPLTESRQPRTRILSRHRRGGGSRGGTRRMAQDGL